MRAKYISIIIFFFFSISIFAKNGSGLIIGLGKGHITENIGPNKDTMGFIGGDKSGYLDYKYNLSIGYRFRVEPKRKPFFYDIDINFGMKKIEGVHHYMLDLGVFDQYTMYRFVIEDLSEKNFYTSVGGIFNYKINRKFFAGLGIEPTYYYSSYKRAKQLDFPILGKLAYNFKYIEVGLTYKVGFKNIIQSKNFDKGSVQDWQIQLYIPF